MSENIQSEDYEVIIRSKTSDGTEVVTSAEAITDKWLANAVAGYDATNQKYSAYFQKKFGDKKNMPTFAIPNGAVAQMVEQWTENPCVGSSILPDTTP